MAKGKGKVKKGFGSYLFVLFLAIIATFLVLITVMLFSPFKSVLGFKYFAFSDEEQVFNVTGGKENEYFNMESIKNININCNFANVKVERYHKVDYYGFRFENYISGFAREEHDTDFNYEVYYSDEKSTLNVDVHEPEGFLYFNRNITITLLIPTSVTYTLDNTSLNITNTSGNIYVGNKEKAVNIVGQEQKNYITIGSLNIKTNSGKAVILPYVNENIKNLFIKTSGGEISARRNLNITNSCEIYSNNGELEFKNLVIGNSFQSKFDLGNAKFYSPYMEGNIALNIKDGYLDLDKFSGSISSNDAVDQMNDATFTINEFTGNLSIPYGNSAKMNLGTVNAGSQIYIHSTDGNVNIKDMKGDVAKIETTSGNVNITTSGKDIDVKTTSGNINISYKSNEIADQIDLVSKTGEVTFKVKSDFAFLLKVYNTKGEYRSDNKVKVDWLDNLVTNPYPILGGTKVVSITTNSNVNIGII